MSCTELCKASPCAVQFRTSPHAVVPMIAADASQLEAQRLCPYHLVMTNIAMESHPFFMGKLTISMAIFHGKL